VADCERDGRPIPAIDGLLAATALTHELVIATRNVEDFKPCGVATYNPFTYIP
jgi:predicted nucleic acid-binding protein